MFYWWKLLFCAVKFSLYLGWLCHRFWYLEWNFFFLPAHSKLSNLKTFSASMNAWNTHSCHLLPLVHFSFHRESRGLSESAPYKNLPSYLFIYSQFQYLFHHVQYKTWVCSSFVVIICDEVPSIKNDAANSHTCRGHYASSLIHCICRIIRQQDFAQISST